MKIDDVMTKDAASCGTSDSLNRAAQLMWERDCGCLPVLEDGKVVGMITDRDICMGAYTQGRSLDQIDVGSAMTRGAFTCAPSDSLEAAMRLMQKQQVRRLPVVTFDGRLAGIVSLNDLAVRAPSHLSRAEKEHEIRQVEETLAAVCRPRPQTWRAPATA